MERKEVAVRVRDLMTRRLVSIDAEDTVTKAARLMDRMRIHSMPCFGSMFVIIVTQGSTLTHPLSSPWLLG